MTEEPGLLDAADVDIEALTPKDWVPVEDEEPTVGGVTDRDEDADA